MTLALFIFLAIFLLLLARRNQKQERHKSLEAKIMGEDEQTTEEAKKSSIRFKFLLDYVEATASQAGINRKRSEWRLILIAVPVFSYIFALFVGMGYFGGIFGAMAGLVLLIVFLRWRKDKTMEAFRYGLQDLTEFGISIFQVSSDVEDLLREIVKKSKNKVLVRECKQILREVDVLGTPAIRVMQRRARQSGVSEYLLLVEMTRNGADSNASLVDAYRDMNTTIRRYYGTEKTILAKTSGMRKVGMVLAFLPLPMFTFFWGSIKPLLHGAVLLAFYGVIAILSFGIYVLNRVVKVRV